MISAELDGLRIRIDQRYDDLRGHIDQRFDDMRSHQVVTQQLLLGWMARYPPPQSYPGYPASGMLPQDFTPPADEGDVPQCEDVD